MVAGAQNGGAASVADAEAAEHEDETKDDATPIEPWSDASLPVSVRQSC